LTVSSSSRSRGLLRRVPRGLLVCLVLTAAVVPACGGDDSEDGPLRVVITDAGYEPSELTVPVGGQVTFVNRSGGLPHSAKDDTPGPVDHSPQPGSTKHDGSEVNHGTSKGFATHALFDNEAQKVIFDAPGKYEYHCSFHPDMSGTIEVVE